VQGTFVDTHVTGSFPISFNQAVFSFQALECAGTGSPILIPYTANTTLDEFTVYYGDIARASHSISKTYAWLAVGA
jgi:hypothetical protein